MKARNKYEKNIYEMRDKLGRITDNHVKFCKSKMNDYVVFKWKSHVCTECNHRWKDNMSSTQIMKGIKCPKCNRELKFIENTGYNVIDKYVGIITTRNGYQVFRLLWVTKSLFTKHPSKTWVSEVAQIWINEKGRTTDLKNLITMYGKSWNTCSGLEVRGASQGYGGYIRTQNINITPHHFYPGQRLIPILKRNGFSTRGHLIAPNYLMSYLINNNLAETFIKVKQYGLLDSLIYSNEETLIPFLPQIKIALRHSYIVKNGSDWRDHIELLNELNMDTHNPKYILPKKFQKEHMILSKKVNVLRDRLAAEEKEKQDKINKAFMNKRNRLLKNVKIKDNEIEVKLFKNEKQVRDEALLLNHCIFSRNYHLKKYSVIFSVRVNDIVTETVQFDLEKGRVESSRGLNNNKTRYNKRIIKLVNKNSSKIMKALKQVS